MWKVKMPTERPATNKRTSSPTREELWQELCDSRDELVAVLHKNNEVIAQNARAIDRNTESIHSVHTLMGNMQRVIESLMAQMVSASIQVSTGVPLRVFLIVVTVMGLIVLALLGVNIPDVIEFFK